MDVHQYVYDESARDLRHQLLRHLRPVDPVGRPAGRPAARGARASSDLLERTLVVIAADHGEAFLEHGREGHAQQPLQRGDARAADPAARRSCSSRGARARRRSRTPTSGRRCSTCSGCRRCPAPTARSLVPLVLAAAGAAGAPTPLRWSGRCSRSSARLGQPARQESASLVSVTDKNLRLLATVSGKTPPELFDRAVDPGEKREPRRSGLRDPPRACARSRTIMRGARTRPGASRRARSSSTSCGSNHLRALGYVVDRCRADRAG